MEEKKKILILLVEDDQSFIDLYRLSLTSGGYDIKVATDGEEGYEMALRDKPDIILLDLLLPKLDGLSLLDRLRNNSEWGRTEPVIILTNMNPDDKALKEVIENKPTYYLMKSNITPQDVIEKIKGVLHTG